MPYEVLIHDVINVDLLRKLTKILPIKGKIHPDYTTLVIDSICLASHFLDVVVLFQV